MTYKSQQYLLQHANLIEGQDRTKHSLN